MSSEISPKIQNQLSQLQQTQQQAQMLVGQKSQIELSLRDVDRALEAVEVTTDDVVLYQTVGNILIKSNKNETIESLKKKEESLDLRLKTFTRQEERIQKRFTEQQERLKEALDTAGITAQ
ncbi:MAG: prefoldin subunit beta [Methanosarcinales archaeon]|uniref:Prefoldin subunit beta n=1 Tax=Candidatus Ethanoperedens thermophilum TaxID=2766897 RepID=A0A848DBW7_9EURY|nr:prefoldin subunit beta [Candidatus Ethanoperedens thermophilum]